MPALKTFNDEHAGATRGTDKGRLWFTHRSPPFCRDGRCLAAQQRARSGERVDALVIGEQSIVANAMEATRMHMQEEAADELVGGQRHRFLSLACGHTIILPLERHAALVVGDETAVGDGDAMGIAGEISEHRFRAGERSFGINDPLDVTQRLDEADEG